jgi:hypothetical protein
MVYNTSTIRQQPKLTRACTACIKAKKKCSFELPKCARCRKREDDCEYANQPLTAPQVDPLQKRNVEDELHVLEISPHTKMTSTVAFSLGPSLTCIRLDDLEYAYTADGRTLSFLSSLLKKDFISFREKGSNTFIHPKTPPSALLTELRYLVATLSSNETFDYTCHRTTTPQDQMNIFTRTMTSLHSAMPTLHSHANLLPFTQALVLIQILTLVVFPPFLLPPWIQQTNEARDQLLRRSTRKLWQLAPNYTPPNLSKHEAYALAESTRRTIAMSLELQAHYSIYKRGFFEHTFFGISVPFDRRFGLWDAEAVEFDEAMEKLGNEDGSQYLVSYREFCEMFDQRKISFVERQFETTMLVGAKGLDRVEERYGVDLA